MAAKERKTMSKEQEVKEEKQLSQKEKIKLLEEIYKGKEKYNKLVKTIKSKCNLTEEEAEDIIQEVIINNLKDCKYKGKADASIETYLFGCGKKKAYDRHQTNKKHTFVSFYNDYEDMAYNHFEELEATEEYKNKVNSILHEIEKLTARQYQAFTWFYLKDKSQKEIAKLMNTSTGAVEQLISRAKINIQKNITTNY